MSPQPRSPHLAKLAERLWMERNMLQLLLFKLVTAKLILAADERRFVTPALAEVERVVDAVRAAEPARAAIVADLAADWGVPAGTLSLRYLAQHSPEPSRTIFEDHRAAFLELTQEIEQTSSENRRLASRALTTIRDSIDVLTGASSVTSNVTTYGPQGHRRAIDDGPRHIDKVL